MASDLAANNTDLAMKVVNDFTAGRLSRRQLATRLLGLGAALASLPSVGRGQDAADSGGEGAADAPAQPTFLATHLDHIALDVTDVPRSREFYERHLGLRVIRGGDDACFMGADRDFFLTLFRAEQPAMNHYCYAIKNYQPDSAMQRLADAGLRPRQTGNRVYFPDPDELTVQVTGA